MTKQFLNFSKSKPKEMIEGTHFESVEGFTLEKLCNFIRRGKDLFKRRISLGEGEESV